MAVGLQATCLIQHGVPRGLQDWKNCLQGAMKHDAQLHPVLVVLSDRSSGLEMIGHGPKEFVLLVS